jgi:hypothetical protein
MVATLPLTFNPNSPDFLLEVPSGSIGRQNARPEINIIPYHFHTNKTAN